MQTVGDVFLQTPWDLVNPLKWFGFHENGICEPREDAVAMTLKKIDALDLAAITKRLCLSGDEGGLDWTPERAQEAALWYKRYLKLHILEPGVVLIPTLDGDKVWHAHILDTRKYHKDCQDIFGEYFHHAPAVATTNHQLAVQESRRRIEVMMELFSKHFGQVGPDKFHWACWNNCSDGF